MGCSQSVSAIAAVKSLTMSRHEPSQPKSVFELSESKANPESTAPQQPQPINFRAIHSAVRWNKPYADVEALLVSLEAVNCADDVNGNRPIHIAAQNGHDELVELLIKKKADLTAKNGKGNTALHMAIGYDYYNTAQLLIKAGSDMNVNNDAKFAAKYGLEGDKSLGIAGLNAASTPLEAMSAFKLCEDDIKKLNRVNFVQAGLKAKKAVGELWSPELQTKFREITQKLT